MTMPDLAARLANREVRGDLVCTQCARVAGTVQGPNNRLTKTVALHVQDPRHAEAVHALRCPYCSGRLWLQNSEEAPVNPLQFNPEALRPHRGRGRGPRSPKLS
jgi:hypothetical protein